MKQKLLNSIRLRAMMLVALLCATLTGTAWATDTTGTINFGSASGSLNVNGASVSGPDSQSKTWSVTTAGTTSFTANSSYAQIGSSSKPATSITFTATISGDDVNVKSFSAKFGGFSGTAGTVTLKVGDTTVGSGSLNTTSDVTVSSSSTKIGKVLTVTVTGISKGVKAYYISYTYEAVSTGATTTTTIDASGITNTDVYVSTAAGSFAATVKDNEDAAIDGASVTWSSSNTDVATINATTGEVTLVAAGSTTITASYAGVENEYQESSDTYELTVTSSAPYVQPTSVTFTMNYEWLGSTSGGNLDDGDLPFEKTQDNVSITITGGSSTNPRGDDDYIRVYKGSTITFEAPSGYEITDITFTTGGNDSWTAPSVSSGTLDGKSWTGSAESVVFTLSGSCFISTAKVTLSLPKSDSDLTLTSSAEVELVKTSVTPYPTSTITWSTSSTGAMTFSSDDETVATVTDAGVITAVSEGSTTITFSQAADEDYKASTNKVVTVTVTDNRSAVATAIDLSSDKTVMKDATAAITATSTMADGFTGDITYSYVSADPAIFSIADGKYTGAGIGETTVTVTATPTGGNAENYKAASQVVAVNVNGTNSISLDLTSKTQAYSAGAFAITATVPTENYNGTVTAESSNENVATVDVNGTTVTVTPKAVGTATITVTAGTGTYYPTPASETCAVTVTAPAGSTTAPSSEVTYTFDFTDNTVWGFPTDYTTGENTYTKDGKTVTLNTPDDSYGYKFNTNVLLFGKTDATLTLPAFDKPVTQISTEGKTGSSSKVKFNIYVNDEAVSKEVTSSVDDHKFDIDSKYQDAGTIYTLKVTNGNNVQIPTLTVHMYQAPSATVQLNTSGYGTFCSVNPMDFSETEGYTAWRISSIEMQNETTGIVTCNKITEAIKGGQGVLLYNKNAGGVQTNVTVNFADGTREFTPSENLLIGTTAPTYVASNEYFGLSGDTFKKVNAGTVPAGKALLPASEVAGVKSFIFVFNDDATGITETRTATREEVEAIFNLGGQRMSKMQRGVNIVNGKKVLVK